MLNDNELPLQPSDEKMNYYTLYFDGCSKGNPGVSGAGYVIYDLYNNELTYNHLFVGKKQTNNYAEYIGLISGMEEANRQNIKNITINGDSMLVINQMNGIYKVNSPNIKPLYEKVKQLEKLFDNISYKHIYRKYNKRADELANIGVSMLS